MQTTLLGVAIAFILALLAALIGPYFVDWNQFKPQFEAEASRIVGLPVRVEGAMDARLLPTPSLRLRGVDVGARFDESNVHVERLDVEFSLGSLLRGEWRADEVALDGLAVDLGLDDSGRMEWASRPGMFNVGTLTVDRLNVTGSLALKDAASRSLVTFDDVSFKGDLRTAASVIRGDGSFANGGVRYPFRLTTGQPATGAGLRLRFNIDPAARPVAADLEGLLTFDNAVPRFEGSLSVARPPLAKDAANKEAADGETPWKLTAKVNADPSSARLEQIEAAYGPDDASALKLTGVAELRLGASPLLQGVLTARQLDADRLLARSGLQGRSPLDMLASARPALGSLPQPPIAVQLAISSDVILLGGRPIQNAGADLRSNGNNWLVDKLEFRAPGSAAFTLSGRIGHRDAKQDFNSQDFNGSVSIDVGEPDSLANWLRGQSEAPYRPQKPIQAQGNIALAGERLAIDQLKLQIDGHAVEGALTLVTTRGASKLDASLKADSIDTAALSAWMPQLGDAPNWLPDEMRLALDFANVDVFGQSVSPVRLQLDYGSKAIVIDRMRIGSGDGVVVEGSGAFDRNAGTGQLTLSTSSTSLDQVAKVVAPFYPALGERIAALPTGAGNVWLGLTLTADKPADGAVNLHANLDLDSPQLKGTLSARSAPRLADLMSLNPARLAQHPFVATGKLSAEHAVALSKAFGLDRCIAVGSTPATIELTMSGGSAKEIATKATLVGRDVDLAVDGTLALADETPHSTFSLAVRKANIAPLFDLPVQGPAANLTLTTRIEQNGRAVRLDGMDGTLGGSHLRGHLAIGLDDRLAVNGDIGTDAFDIAPVVAAAIGSMGRADNDPLGGSLLGGWHGRIGFESLRAISPVGEMRPLRGTLEADGSAITLAASTASFAGGSGKIDLAAKRDADGVSLTGHLQLSGADAGKLRWRGLAMPAGALSADFTFNGVGRSAAALTGGINGSGMATLDHATIAGFDAKVFQAAIEASESGQTKDEGRFAALLDPILAKGRLAFDHAELPLIMKDGRISLANAVLNSSDARLTLFGQYDLAADQFELRTALAPAATGAFGGTSAASRPDIRITWSGAPDAPRRTLDVSALSSWLTLRTIERETKRLEQLETMKVPQPAPAEPVPSHAPSAAISSQITEQPASSEAKPALPPLPPPIDVKPAPNPPRPAAPARPHPPLILAPNGG